MKKAVFYARVSSSAQEKEKTIESQIAELKRQIKEAGNILVKEYIDNGFSGAMLSRPAMDQLRQDIKTNLFDTIYFHNADRIARDVTYQNIIIGEILRYKKQIIINGQDYIHNPENKFTLTVLGAVAELEKAKTLERSMRGRQYHLKQGRLLAHGHHIYGYNYIRKTENSPASYQINPAEAKIVKYIFELYSKGNISYRELVRNLNKKFKPRQGRKWEWSQLAYLLKNETYTGIKYFNTSTDTNALRKFEGRIKKIHRIPTERSTWIGIKIPRLISQDLFNKAQDKIKYNLACYRNARKTQMLSNMVFCGVCHKRCFAYHRCYAVERRGQKQIYQKTIYKCGGALHKSHNREIHSKILEPCVLKMIEKYLFNPFKLKQCMDYFTKTNITNQKEIEKQIKQVKSKILGIHKQKKRIVHLYSLGDLERETYVEKVNSYDQDIKSLEQQNKELAQSVPVFNNPEEVMASVINYSKKAKARFNKLTPRQFILDYLNKIEYLYNNGIDQVTLYGSVPAGIAKLSFIINDKIERNKALQQLKRENKQKGLSGSEIISNKKYHKLITKI